MCKKTVIIGKGSKGKEMLLFFVLFRLRNEGCEELSIFVPEKSRCIGETPLLESRQGSLL
jgi:hypothetical protein